MNTEFFKYDFEIQNAKKNGGVVVIPSDFVKSQEIVDLLEISINPPIDKKLDFYKLLTEVRKKNIDLALYFYPEEFKKEAQKIEDFFKKYPNLKYPLPEIVYNHPASIKFPDLFPDLLASRGIIKEEDIPIIEEHIKNKKPYFISKKTPPPPKIPKDITLPVVSEVFPDFWEKQTALSFYKSEGLDPSPSLTLALYSTGLFGMLGLAKSNVAIKQATNLTKFYLGHDVLQTAWHKVIEPVWSNIQQYDEKTREELQKVGSEILSISYYSLPILRFGFQYLSDTLLKAPPNTLLGQVVNPFRKIAVKDLGFRLKTVLGYEVAKKLGLSEPPSIPAYGSDVSKHIETWIKVIDKPLTTQEINLLRDFLTSAIMTKDSIPAISMWRLPSVGKISAEQWARAITTLTGIRPYWTNLQYIIKEMSPSLLFVRKYTPVYKRYIHPEGEYIWEDITEKPITIDDLPPYTYKHIIFTGKYQPPKAPITRISDIPSKIPTPPKTPIPTPPPVEQIPKPTMPREVEKPAEKLHILNIQVSLVEENLKKAISQIEKMLECPFEKITIEKISNNILQFENPAKKISVKFNIVPHLHAFFPHEIIERIEKLNIGSKISFKIDTSLTDFEKVLLNPEYPPHKFIIDFNKKLRQTYQRPAVINYQDGYVYIAYGTFAIVEPIKEKLPSLSDVPISIKDVLNVFPKDLVEKGYVNLDDLKSDTNYVKIILSKDNVVFVRSDVLKPVVRLLKKLNVKALEVEFYGEKKPVVFNSKNKKIIVMYTDKEKIWDTETIKEINVLSQLDIDKLNAKEKSFVYKPQELEEPLKEDSIEYFSASKHSKKLTPSFAWHNPDEGLVFINRVNRLSGAEMYEKFVKFINHISGIIRQRMHKVKPPTVITQWKKIEKEVLGYHKKGLISLSLRAGIVPLHEFGHYFHYLVENEIPEVFDKLVDLVDKYRHTELFNITRYTRPVFDSVSKGYVAYRMRWSELLADYIAMYILDYNLAEQLAPNFTKEFNNFLKENNLYDILNPSTGETFFKYEHPAKVFAEQVATEIKEQVKQVLNLPKTAEHILVDLENNTKDFVAHFLDTLSQISIYNNPILAEVYLDLLVAKEVRPAEFLFHLSDDILRLKETEKKLSAMARKKVMSIIDRYVVLNRIPTYEELLPELGKEGLKEAIDFLKQIKNLSRKALEKYIDTIKEVNPRVAENLRSSLSEWDTKGWEYIPLGVQEGNFSIYGEIEIGKTTFTYFYSTDELSLAEKLAEELLNLGYQKVRVYGTQGFMSTIKKPDGSYGVVITLGRSPSSYKEHIGKLKGKEVVRTIDMRESEEWYRNLRYNMFTLEQMLNILAGKGVRIPREEFHKLIDSLGTNPHLLRRHKVPTFHYTAENLFYNTMNYVEFLSRSIGRIYIKDALAKKTNKITLLRSEEQKLIENWTQYLYSTYVPLVGLGYLVRLSYLTYNVGYYIANLFQVPQMMCILAYHYGWNNVLKAYENALLSWITGRPVGKYKDVVAKVFEEAKSIGEMEAHLTDIMARTVKSKINQSQLKTIKKIAFDVFNNIFFGIDAITEKFINRPLGILLSTYLGLELYEQGYHPVFLGNRIAIDPNTEEGQRQLLLFAILGNNYINIAYDSLNISPASRTDIIWRFAKIFTSFPLHFSAIDYSIYLSKPYGVVSRFRDWQFKDEADKKRFFEYVTTAYRKTTYFLWRLLFAGIKALPFPLGVLLGLWFRKKKKHLETEILTKVSPETLANFMLYGGFGLLGLDLSFNFAYSDSLLNLFDTSQLIVVRYLNEIMRSSQYITDPVARKRIEQYLPVVIARRLRNAKALTLKDALDDFDMIGLTDTDITLAKIGITTLKVRRLKELRKAKKVLEQYIRKKEDFYADQMAMVIAEMQLLFIDLFRREVKGDELKTIKNKISELNSDYIDLIERARADGIIITMKQIENRVRMLMDTKELLKRVPKELKDYYFKILIAYTQMPEASKKKLLEEWEKYKKDLEKLTPKPTDDFAESIYDYLEKIYNRKNFVNY